jgi:hypothetical protein
MYTEHLIGLRAGADGTQEEVNEMEATPAVDEDVMERLKDLGTVYIVRRSLCGYFS